MLNVCGWVGCGSRSATVGDSRSGQLGCRPATAALCVVAYAESPEASVEVVC